MGFKGLPVCFCGYALLVYGLGQYMWKNGFDIRTCIVCVGHRFGRMFWCVNCLGVWMKGMCWKAACVCVVVVCMLPDCVVHVSLVSFGFGSCRRSRSRRAVSSRPML